ncbi:hypothetical protein [Streptomyces harbinensis]
MHFDHHQHTDHLAHMQPDFSQNSAATPAPLQSAQICGCQHAPAPAPVPARPQIHISTGGVVVVILGGVFLTVTIGVILTSLLLTVAIVAGALAMVAFAWPWSPCPSSRCPRISSRTTTLPLRASSFTEYEERKNPDELLRPQEE